jgi:hypothetical protein
MPASLHFSRAASKVGGLAHLVFISQIMPVTATSMDDASEVFEMLRLLVTMLISFFIGCFCMWMFMDYPNVRNRAEPKRRMPKRRDQEAQCEITYEEMSHMHYALHREKEDKQRVIDSYERELETLKSYAQVMKDTSETDKQDAERFRADLNQVKLDLKRVYFLLIESKNYELQDSLDWANGHQQHERVVSPRAGVPLRSLRYSSSHQVPPVQQL